MTMNLKTRWYYANHRKIVNWHSCCITSSQSCTAGISELHSAVDLLQSCVAGCLAFAEMQDGGGGGGGGFQSLAFTFVMAMQCCDYSQLLKLHNHVLGMSGLHPAVD